MPRRSLSFPFLLCALLVAAAARADDCRQGDDTWLWSLPRGTAPRALLAVSTAAPLDALQLVDGAGTATPLAIDAQGGPPWHHLARLDGAAVGARVEALRGGTVVACTRVDGGQPDAARGWDLAHEAFYAAWVERLFDAPAAESLSVPALTPLLADPARNLLHGHLGANEDAGLVAEPDCADLPYYLRAYVAWKLGLPLAWRACSRGDALSPPRCDRPRYEEALLAGDASTATFRAVTRRLMDTVHSGSARTALDDEKSDVYAVPLDRRHLWPGTLYADPYGHTLVVVKWLPQRGDEAGLLLAVDAQPDNSVGRKRFWEGTFLFAPQPNAGPGFKRLRPVVRTGEGLRELASTFLDGSDGLPPQSLEQGALAARDFYARVHRLVNPAGLTPAATYEAALAALLEQLDTRLTAVATGEAWMQAHPDTVVTMPRGAAIFETVGEWEDYSTPSRDLRLLIALAVLDELPARLRAYPELFRLDGQPVEAAAAAVEALHRQRLGERSITYTRSDGSPQVLTLAEVYARRAALEVAYNPNDCIERRWGATPDTPDYATCRREAPAAQRARMESYREWFHELRRPPR